MTDTVTVIYGVNDRYAPMAAASLRSLIRRSDGTRRYQVCFLHLGLAPEHQERLLSMGGENVRVSALDAAELMGADRWPRSDRFGPEIYLRLYAPLAFESARRLVWLDADTLLLRDAAALFDTPLRGAALGACRSFPTPFLDGYARRTVGVSPEEYFNSGVLLIDPPRFEEAKLRERCRRILLEKPQLLCFDQDALNLAARGTYRLLPNAWNVQWTNHLHPARDVSERPARLERVWMEAAEREPFLLHFSSAFKPCDYPDAWNAALFWAAALDTPYRREFAELLERRRQKPMAFRPVFPPWRGFRRNAALAGGEYALRELFSNLLHLDGEVPC